MIVIIRVLKGVKGREMSVIITGMKMPPFCGGCEIDDCVNREYETNKRPDDCPLKSVEELIQQIESYAECKITEGQVRYVKLSDVKSLIKKYCGMEDT